jgi:meso-butanediol dehydrogenase/(S,S)-butanediol dehydrogenase/diacetyl reductase
VTTSASSGRLEGRVAFVTGTAAGMGRAIALRFAREGARIVGCDIDAAGDAETAELVRGLGGEMLVVSPTDVAEREQVRAWIAAGVEEFGRLDILVNHAAGVRWGLIEDTEPEDWTFTLRSEIDSVYHACQAAWPPFKAGGGGSVVNFASIAGIVGSAESPKLAHTAGKAAVAALTRQLAAEGAPFGIRVNTVTPGVIETPSSEPLIAMGDDGPLGKMLRAIPLGRAGRGDDIANAVLFLASDEADFVTGHELVVTQ